MNNAIANIKVRVVIRKPLYLEGSIADPTVHETVYNTSYSGSMAELLELAADYASQAVQNHWKVYKSVLAVVSTTAVIGNTEYRDAELLRIRKDYDGYTTVEGQGLVPNLPAYNHTTTNN